MKSKAVNSQAADSSKVSKAWPDCRISGSNDQLDASPASVVIKESETDWRRGILFRRVVGSCNPSSEIHRRRLLVLDIPVFAPCKNDSGSLINDESFEGKQFKYKSPVTGWR